MFQCELCGWETNAKVYLEDHLRINHTAGVTAGVKNRCWQCAQCGTASTTKAQLARHMQQYHVKGTLRCQFCPSDHKKLYNKDGLKYHVKQVHRRVCVCTKCSMSYPMNHKLYHHYRTRHLNYCRYVCKMCGSQFQNMSNGRAHYLAVHLSEKGENGQAVRLKGRYTEEFWAKNDVILDKKTSDPEYPTDEHIMTRMDADRALITMVTGNDVAPADAADKFDNRDPTVGAKVTKSKKAPTKKKKLEDVP